MCNNEINASNVIKKLRQEKNLTQEELGHILGVKKSAVQKYEDGTIKNLKLDTIRTLCETFHIVPWRIVFPDKSREWIVNLDADNIGESKKKWLEIVLKEEYSEDCFIMVQLLSQLNDEGVNKTLSYMKDLLEIEKYLNKR